MAAESGLPAAVELFARQWRLALLVALPLLLGVGVYAQALPPVYESGTTVAFSPREDVPVSADVIRVTLPRYVAYLTAPDTVRELAAALGEPSELLGEALDVSVATDTANLGIVVRGRDPQLVARSANLAAEAAAEYSRQDRLLEGTQVAPAVAPTQPAGPPRRLLQLAGLLAALIAGTAAAVVAERGRPRVRDEDELSVASGLPVLGRVPLSRLLRSGATLEVTDPQLGSAMRALTVQAARSGDRPWRVLAVTSPSNGDGKTTVALGYAAAAARRGQSVVLIDADLHQAGLSEALGLDGVPGLPDLLEATVDLQACLRPGPVDGVTVLPTAVRPAAGDLLSRGLGELLEAVSGRADLVVVDCPPVQDDDARGVLAQAGAVLLVVRAGTPARAVQAGVRVLAGLRVSLVGAVLNHARRPVTPGYSGAPLVEP